MGSQESIAIGLSDESGACRLELDPRVSSILGLNAGMPPLVDRHNALDLGAVGWGLGAL